MGFIDRFMHRPEQLTGVESSIDANSQNKPEVQQLQENESPQCVEARMSFNRSIYNIKKEIQHVAETIDRVKHHQKGLHTANTKFIGSEKEQLSQKMQSRIGNDEARRNNAIRQAKGEFQNLRNTTVATANLFEKNGLNSSEFYARYDELLSDFNRYLAKNDLPIIQISEEVPELQHLGDDEESAA